MFGAPLRVWPVDGAVRVIDSRNFALGQRVVVAGGALHWKVVDIPDGATIMVRRWHWFDTITAFIERRLA